MSAKLSLNHQEHAIPSTKEQFSSLINSFSPQHGDLKEKTLMYVFRGTFSDGERAVASMVTDGKFGTLHLLFELLGRPDFSQAGFLIKNLQAGDVQQLLHAFTPFHAEAAAHPNVAFLQTALAEKSDVECVLVNKDTQSSTDREQYLRVKTNLLFDLFNQGVLRGSDGLARQALLDSFSTLPNRYLSADGKFLVSKREDPSFLRQVSAFDEYEGEVAGAAVAGIDKFPSLMSTRGERLKTDGNRIVPSVMIRDGAYVGKRNIFMFHAAVNLAAYIGDDNLIDSHASIASAAQIGNKNKIGSFVSLEGVLSPANAVPVYIGDENFVGSFARVGTGIRIGNKNFIASGVNLSLGTKIRDCRESSSSKGEYLTPKELNENFHSLAIVPNNATREFNGVAIVPGEYVLFENSEEFMKRFEGDTRIKAAK